jgi:hypothetical protein
MPTSLCTERWHTGKEKAENSGKTRGWRDWKGKAVTLRNRKLGSWVQAGLSGPRESEAVISDRVPEQSEAEDRETLS